MRVTEQFLAAVQEELDRKAARRRKRREQLLKVLGSVLAALAGLAISGFCWMVLAAIVRDYWWTALPAPGYWSYFMLATILHTGALVPRSKPWWHTTKPA